MEKDGSREQIDAWFAAHRAGLVEDIRRLVEIKSVSVPCAPPHIFGAGCAAALDAWLALGRRYGLQAENHGYALGSLTHGRGREEDSIAIWGHLDVVEEGEGWRWPPYACEQAGDFLIGRGVQDNKGPLVTALYALRCIRELGLPLKSTVRIIAGCNEEAGMADVPLYLAQRPAPRLSFVADAGFPVCYAEKGRMVAVLRSPALPGAFVQLWGGSAPNLLPDSAGATLRPLPWVEALAACPPEGVSAARQGGHWHFRAGGRSAHAAFPAGGINAIGLLCAALAANAAGPGGTALGFLARVCGETEGRTLGIQTTDKGNGDVTCCGSVLRIEGGHALLTLDIRYPAPLEGATLFAVLSAAAAAAGFTAELVSGSPAFSQDPGGPLVQTLQGVYHRETGSAAPAYTMGGGTYARLIPRAVAFGPGLPADFTPLCLPQGHGSCHTPNEAQYLPSLLLAGRIYVHSLLALDNLTL